MPEEPTDEAHASAAQATPEKDADRLDGTLGKAVEGAHIFLAEFIHLVAVARHLA